MKSAYRISLTLLPIMALSHGAPVYAQDAPETPAAEQPAYPSARNGPESGPPSGPPSGYGRPAGWTVTAGAVVFASPRFSGSDDMRIMPVPSIEISDGKRFSLSVQRGLRYELIKDETFTLGPIVRPDFGRSRKQTDKYLPGLDKVSFAPEAGVFAEAKLVGDLSLNGEIRRAIGGHDGIVAEIGASYVSRTGKLLYGFGPEISYADKSHMQSYYGVSKAAAERSAFAAYAPGAGIKSAGLSGFAVYFLKYGISLNAFAGYNRLVGDAARSPIVTGENGSRNQFAGGVGISLPLLGGRPPKR